MFWKKYVRMSKRSSVEIVARVGFSLIGGGLDASAVVVDDTVKLVFSALLVQIVEALDGSVMVIAVVVRFRVPIAIPGVRSAFGVVDRFVPPGMMFGFIDVVLRSATMLSLDR
jgi:hypothetical protein